MEKPNTKEEKDNYQDYKSERNNLFDSEFTKESDRAAVILSASILDNALLSLLEIYLSAVNGSEDRLLKGQNAPLSDFSSRIDMTNRLGLISNKFCRDLHLIRKIRNEFAHNIEGCTFEKSSTKSRILALIKSSDFIEYNKDIRENFPRGPRGDFQNIVSVMLWIIHDKIEEIVPIEEGELEWIYLQEDFRKEKGITTTQPHPNPPAHSLHPQTTHEPHL
jgi:hypothetical protein